MTVGSEMAVVRLEEEAMVDVTVAFEEGNMGSGDMEVEVARLVAPEETGTADGEDASVGATAERGVVVNLVEEVRVVVQMAAQVADVGVVATVETMEGAATSVGGRVVEVNEEVERRVVHLEGAMAAAMAAGVTARDSVVVGHSAVDSEAECVAGLVVASQVAFVVVSWEVALRVVSAEEAWAAVTWEAEL